MPVDVRDNGHESGPLHLSSSRSTESKLTGPTISSQKLTRTVDELDPNPENYVKTGKTPWRQLRLLAEQLTDRQIEVLIQELRKDPGRLLVPALAELALDLSTSKAVKLAGRGDTGWHDSPALAWS